MADPKDRPPDAVRKNLKGDWVDSKGNVIGSAGGGRAGYRAVDFNADGVLVFKDTGEPVPKKGEEASKPSEKPAVDAPEKESASAEKAEAAGGEPVKTELASPGQTGPPREQDFKDPQDWVNALNLYRAKLAAQKATAKSNANTMRQQ